MRKLNAERAQEIRKRCAAGESIRSLSTAFGITSTNCWLVVRGKIWKNEAGSLKPAHAALDPTDIVGRKICGSTVIAYVGRKYERGHHYYECHCECGKRRFLTRQNLVGSAVRGCVCKSIRKGSASPTFKHGASDSRAYHTWSGMKARCYNPKSKKFYRYGARGIRVCDAWRTDFAAFLKDMGSPPTPRHTLDRIDNDGHYEPSNCRWADQKTQQNNRENNRHIIFRGEPRSVVELGEEFGIPAKIIRQRLDRDGLSAEESVLRPYKPGNRGVRLTEVIFPRGEA